MRGNPGNLRLVIAFLANTNAAGTATSVIIPPPHLAGDKSAPPLITGAMFGAMLDPEFIAIV
jgi:hypothetical protein